MSRLLFEERRRLPSPLSVKNTISITAPPELPRPAQKSFLGKCLPSLIGLLVVAVIVATIATGMRIITPQTLIYPFIMLIAATGIYQGTSSSGISTAEIDEERADYLRYLSQIRRKILISEERQRAALQWSHPQPQDLDTIIGLRRQWERDHADLDFLHIRLGTHDIASDVTLRVHDIESDIDLEPVSYTALNHLLTIHKTIPDAPIAISLTAHPIITIYCTPNKNENDKNSLASQQEMLPYSDNIARTKIYDHPSSGSFASHNDIYPMIRAWIAQSVVWHNPTVLTVAIASTNIESPELNWAKWLPHTDIPGEEDGAGNARYLSADAEHLAYLLSPTLTQLPRFSSSNPQPYKHTIIIVDIPDADLSLFVPPEGLKGVTLIRITHEKPHFDQLFDPTQPVLALRDGKLLRWQNDEWKPFVNHPDALEAAQTTHTARLLSRWGYHTFSKNTRQSATIGASFTSLLGIEDASNLDVPALWRQRTREEELRVPIGTTSTGNPIYFDLKDEAEGGMGPHGLMIGMTGSGKSQTLMAILLALLTTHSADRLIVIYADFKGEAGADIFRDFPQVVAVISNMSEKKSLAERFADTLRGEVARREKLLRDYGREVQGSTFSSVREYEEAIANGFDLPPIPTLFIIADEFSLMLQQYPEYAELFDYIARKGRSFRIHILFASQTLDVGKIKDIDKNTSYRIGLKVASPSISRQVIGVEDAYHIESGRDHKGEGFLVPSPGAIPIKFRSTYVDGIYEPPTKSNNFTINTELKPKLFTASYVEPPEETINYTPQEASIDTLKPVAKLITTIGNQLQEHGPTAPKLWLPPLDEPITLDTFHRDLYDETLDPDNDSNQENNSLTWPLGEIDRPFDMRRDTLIFDATSAAGNMIIHGGPKSGKSTALQTFILSAAWKYSPHDVQFYCLDYSGGPLRPLESLAHVGAVSSGFEEEKIRRTFGELEQLLLSRQLLFKEHRISSIDQFRIERKHNPELNDGFGEVFLIVDNFYGFSRDKTDQFNTRNPLLPRLADLINNGLPYGIHVIMTTPNWMEVPLNIRDNFGLRLELRLHDPQDSNVRLHGALRRPAESVPIDQPGRGLTMSAEHFLFALPRFDGLPITNDLAEAIENSIVDINGRYPDDAAPPVRLLPTNLMIEELPFVYREPEQVVIGKYENDLQPVIQDFMESPLMMIFGDSRSGKTSTLRHIIRTIKENSDAESVAFTVIDRRLHLVDEKLFPDNEYTANLDRVTPAMLGLANLLEQRRPPANLSQEELQSWKFIGQKHYLIIDDLDQIPDSSGVSGPYAGIKPWSAIAKLLGQAKDLGLRVIVASRASGAAHNIMTNQLLSKLDDLNATTIMLSRNSQDSQKIRNHKFQRLIPGRAILLSDEHDGVFIQLVNPLATQEPISFPNAGDIFTQRSFFTKN